jgi:hypothetical protein
LSANILTQLDGWRKGFVDKAPTVSSMPFRYIPRRSFAPCGRDAVSEAVNQNNNKDLSELFHRLNNELGIILSHAELLEAKCDQDKNRSRASQVVAAALEAMGTARNIRLQINDLTLVK